MTNAPDLWDHRALINACLRHGTYFFWQGPGTMLISRKGIVEVLRDMIASGYKVLGYEGFELDGADVHPRIDLIYDAERRPDITDPIEVVAQWPAEIWVDVVLARSP
jgi:hypothetical protein